MTKEDLEKENEELKKEVERLKEENKNWELRFNPQANCCSNK